MHVKQTDTSGFQMEAHGSSTTGLPRLPSQGAFCHF